MEDEPEPMPGDSFYMKAFWDLSTERAIGFTIGPIPWSSIRKYAHIHGLQWYMMDLFEAVIRGMDSAYMKHAEKTRKTASKRASSDRSRSSISERK